MNDEPQWRDVDTRDGYDRWAPNYDEEGNPLLALEEPEADRALGEVTGLDVLDVGTGTGRHALRLAARGARVTAIDFSDEMLAKARAKKGADRVRFENHDVTERLPYPDGSFDRVLSALVLEHVPDVEAFLRELARVTRETLPEERPAALHARLADALADLDGVSHSLVATHYEQAGNGAEAHRHAGWIIDLERSAQQVAIPTTLQASLMARVDRLGSAREMLQIGAAIGREFSYELISVVAGLPDAVLPPVSSTYLL